MATREIIMVGISGKLYEQLKERAEHLEMSVEEHLQNIISESLFAEIEYPEDQKYKEESVEQL